MRKFTFKKRMAALLVASMVLGLPACGSTTDTADTAPSEQGTTEAVTESTGTDSSSSGESDTSLAYAPVGPATLEETFASDSADEEAAPSVQDGDVIVDIDFNDGDIDNFCQYTNGGEFTFKNEGGELAVDIKKVGGVDYANQVYWDGFNLSHGCVYTYSFDAYCDIDRQIEYRLQINGGDYHAYMGDYLQITTEKTNYSFDFEMTEDSDPAPRIVFNMGKMSDMEGSPEEHKVYIDNIKLVVKDASNAEVISGLPNYVNVSVNQLGYKPDDEKTVFVKGTDYSEFYICDENTQEIVYTGSLDAGVEDAGTLLTIQQGDFSDFNTPGRYYICTNDTASYPFEIGDGLYDDLYKDTVLMLYKQRCGTETDASIAGDFAHGDCHHTDATVYGSTETKDVSGGWHDAGDYGRYTVSTAKTIADLFNAYIDFGIEDDDLGIPESGNGIPDILDEAKVGVDWMYKMQDEATGGVYHKVTCLVFPESVPPEDETDELVLAPISDTATGDYVAIMAWASRMYRDYDSEYADKLLAAAEKAWDYLSSREIVIGYKNPEDIVTGEYPDNGISDERYWAATELYICGRDDLEDAVKEGLDNDSLKRNLGWADIGTYADNNLAHSDLSLADSAKSRVLERADQIIDRTEGDMYNMALGETYPWGSNMTVANNGEILYMAYNLSGDEKYASLAEKQTDYLLGANSLGYCFVTGYGTLCPTAVHHRPSEVAGYAMIGMLVGGPDNGLDDSYAKAVLTGQAPAMCYADNQQSYSTNEVTIYWNSPLIYILSAER